MRIDVFLPFYKKTSLAQLRQCVSSMAHQLNQSCCLVLIQDGPTTFNMDALSDLLITINHRHVLLPVNLGLPDALNAAADESDADWIVRMDSDDMAEPDRIQKTLDAIHSTDWVLFGGQITEITGLMREVPLDNDSIRNFARTRNPFNHMTTAFKLDAFRAVGGYPSLQGFEDYGLWLKLMTKGRVGNLSDTLCSVQFAEEDLRRRWGLKYAINEWRFYSWWRKQEFEIRPNNIAWLVRILMRLTPIKIANRVYAAIRNNQ